MKIIGKNSENGGDYIAIVTHVELEKLSDKYYGNSSLGKLQVGSEMNLGAGHDFRSQIQSACKAMEDSMKSFERARDTLLKFSVMVGQLPAPDADEVAS